MLEPGFDLTRPVARMIIGLQLQIQHRAEQDDAAPA